MADIATKNLLAVQLANSRKAIEALSSQLSTKEVDEVAQDNADVRMASMLLTMLDKAPKAVNGNDGVDGKDGKDGSNGLNGINGKNGLDGKTGANGKDGLDGFDGLDGAKGDTGFDGADGADGKDGVDGSNGKDGIAGINGIDGIDGKDGANGVDGKNGIDGTNGINGKDGASVLSIKSTPKSYVFTLDNGKEFDVAIPTLAMPQPVYVQSKEGIISKDGKDGSTGAQGVVGPQGKEGARGKRGDDGVGIKDITADGATLKVKLTDGSTKDIKMPVRGSAPVAPFTTQRALRTPLDGSKAGIVATNVEDAFTEVATGSLFGPTVIEEIGDTYKLLTYVNGNITKIETWVNETKAIKLFTKVLVYVSGNISTIINVDEVSKKVITKNIYYNAENNITSTRTLVS